MIKSRDEDTKLFQHILGEKNLSSEIKGYEYLTKEIIMFPSNVIKFFSIMKTCPGEAFELEDYRKNPRDHDKKKKLLKNVRKKKKSDHKSFNQFKY